MKKKYFFILIVIFLLIAIYFWRYRQVIIIKNQVPAIATSVVNVNLREIENGLLKDFLQHPIIYLERDTIEVTEEEYSLLDDVTIPRNLFFFTNSNQLKGIWVSSFLELDEDHQINKYLIDEGFKMKEHTSFKTFEKNNFYVLLDNKRMLIAYQWNNDNDISTGLEIVFNNNEFLLEEDDLFTSILSSNNEIVYSSSNKNFVNISFDEGKLLAKGKIIQHPFTANKTFFNKTSIASISTKIDQTKSSFKKTINLIDFSRFTDLTQLSLDSVLNKWNGKIDFNLKSIEYKTDTIVTYDYDDDFNKIELKSTQQLIVPDLTLNLESDNNHDLWSYLMLNNSIKTIEEDTLLTTIPLYQFHARNVKNKLRISTNKEYKKQSGNELNNLFTAHVNIEKYLKNQFDFYQFPVDNEYLNLFQKFSLELSNESELRMEIHLKDYDRNFLGQLIKH